MENQLIKVGLQKNLFDRINERLPEHLALVDVVSDLLGISTDSAYRRIRADKTLGLDETVLLCRKFNISLDETLELAPGRAEYKYTPLDLQDINNYYVYMRALSANMARLRLAGGETIMSALDVPVFHFLSLKELTFFKLFAWAQSAYHFSGLYEHFAAQIERVDLLECYNKLVDDFGNIPSTEIWTNSTTDTFLKLLNYHFEMGHFQKKETVLLLCEQFLALLRNVQGWADKGYKDADSKIPFHLYLSEVDLDNSFILLKQPDATSCILKLFTINSLSITDPLFCRETAAWLHNLAQRSTLISITSEKERHKFFTRQIQKVRIMIEMVCKDALI